MTYTYFRKKSLVSILSILLVGALTACSTGTPNASSDDSDAFALARASYPEMAPYPDESAFTDSSTGEIKDGFYDAYDAWQEDRQAQQNQAGLYQDDFKGFLGKSIPQFLSGPEKENRIYSPLSVYLALGMLAELTDGNSRRQILDLLGTDSIQKLRSQASALWNANYCNDGATTSILASSLWLNEDISFAPSAMKQLTETYYASSYQGTMGSKEFNKALQNWLNEQTGGLLEDQASGVNLDADTILALATTVYFRAKWSEEFMEGNTSPDVFHASEKDITCDFMHQTDSQEYYWGDKFSATAKQFEGGGSMWLILPDEGITADELLKDEETMAFLLSNGDWENSKHLTVNLAVPKFDATSNLNLISSLQELGVTDVFDGNVSDFSPMTKDTDGIFVSKAEHAARVMIDEEGCTAAAYTVMAVCGAAMPPEEEVDFVVNRPFLFAITGNDGLPLFAGVVELPA